MTATRSSGFRVTARAGVLSVLAATALVSAGPAAPARAATVTDLGAGWADVINDHGQVAGHFSDPAGHGHAFLWTPGRGRRDLGGLGGGGVAVTAINELGQVAGWASTPSGASHAFRWTPSGGMRDLGTLGGADSFAAAMNSSGTVVGSSTTAGGDRRAFVWTPSTGMRGLPARTAQANDINDRGQVVGSFLAQRRPPATWHLFLWSRSTGLRNLGRPRVPVEGHFTIGGWLNERGQVAGTYGTATDVTGAFRWTRPTGFQLLAARPGNQLGHAQSINAAGQITGVYLRSNDIYAFRWSPRTGLLVLGVVSDDWHETGTWKLNNRGEVSGTTYTHTGTRRISAVRWTSSTGLRTLPGLGGDWSGTTGINDRGQIAGWARTPSGETHAVLWRP